MIETITVVFENILEPADFGGEFSIFPQPEIDYARLRLLVAEDKFAKITIIRNEDAMLPVRDGENLGVANAAGVVVANTPRIVALRDEIWDQACIGTLIQQEPHPCVERTEV